MKVQFVGVYQGPANLYKNTDLDAANLCSLFTQEEGARWRENIVKKKNTFRDLFPGKDFMPSTWGNALVKQWLGGFVEVPPDANVLHTIYHAFEPWALRGIQREKREPLWLEFKEPPGLGALCINKEARIKQINHEFENGTLLVKCGVTWADIISDNSDEVPRLQKFHSASLLVNNQDQSKFYDKGMGAIYSGETCTVYASSPVDMKSSEYNVEKYRELVAHRESLEKQAQTTLSINKTLMQAARGGGMTSHNEVLGVLRKSCLLGMFFAVKKDAGPRPDKTGLPAAGQKRTEREKMIRELRTRNNLNDFPIFCVGKSKTTLELID